MEPKTERTYEKRSVSNAFRGVELLAVQCSVCAVLVLIAFLLKWIPGNTFSTLATVFRSAMLENTVFTAVATPTAAQPTNDDAAQLQTELSTETESFVQPLKEGTLTSPYGKRRDPFSDEETFHEGIDIAAVHGAPIYAVYSGTVTTAEYDESGYGHYMVVTCKNGEKYVFAHCSSIDVSVGDQVKAGDVVAYVGDSGRASGDHVHFEWIVNGNTVDPLTVFPEMTYV